MGNELPIPAGPGGLELDAASADDAAAGSVRADPGGRDEGAVLLARHLAGDAHAFPELVAAFGPAVQRYLRRAGLPGGVADDLFQETFLRVHGAARQYDGARPFRGWLFAIAGNLVRSQLRRQRVRRVLTGWWRRGDDAGAEPEPPDPPDGAPDAERLVGARERLVWLEGALAGLKDDVRQALLLTQVEGLAYEDAALALGAPVATVKTWVRRGRLALAAELARREEPTGTAPPQRGSGTP